MLSQIALFTAGIARLVGGLGMSLAIATSPPQQSAPQQSTPQQSSMLLATAYTDLTLPTLRRGDRGRSVQQLQQILSDHGFLHAAGVRLGDPDGAVVDGVFGRITQAAVRDLQRHYQIPVTGQVNPVTWEVLDMRENPYRSPIPWRS